jgi:5-methylcytosine-specific restriction protein B
VAFVSAQHIAASLEYLAEHTHTLLISILAAGRAGVVVGDDDTSTVAFGGGQETAFLGDFAAPVGGPVAAPFYVPFGSPQGKSRWRDRKYAGSSLQQQRKQRPAVLVQNSGDNKRWRFQPGLADAISERPDWFVGDVPISLVHLGVWLFRKQEITSLEDLAHLVTTTFKLPQQLIDGGVFTADIPPALATLPLADQPITDQELFGLLQAPPAAPTTAETPASSAEEWTLLGADALDELDGLRGAERPARRALAALQAGMHVVLTGAPGTGKTSLAKVLFDRVGLPYTIAPATDQWTTFETIGGYFPQPEAGDALDFMPGIVVSAIEEGRCLVIDELNRADIDKAFGELFTLLSGSPVALPYRKRSDGGFKKLRIVWEAGTSGDGVHEYVVPPWWRIIGTMNDADKASLKRLSLAFVRRFAFVPLEVPGAADYEAIIVDSSTELPDSDLLRAVRDGLVALFAADAGGLKSIGFPIGPAIPLAMLRHAAAQIALTGGGDVQVLVSEVLTLYLVPQLQGRPDLHSKVLSLLQPHIGADETAAFAHNLAVWTGFAQQ